MSCISFYDIKNKAEDFLIERFGFGRYCLRCPKVCDAVHACKLGLKQETRSIRAKQVFQVFLTEINLLDDERTTESNRIRNGRLRKCFGEQPLKTRESEIETV